MIKQLRSLFTAKSKCPPLRELDQLYEKAISLLPANAKREYCERLIDRAEFEIQNTSCGLEIPKLRQLIRSAKKELSLWDREN